MTSEREKYLAKCSKREMTLRRLIKYYKLELKKAKAVCSSYDLKALGRKPFGYRIHIVAVKETKLMLQSLCHELARLKGMDRVVVPREAGYELTVEGYTGYCCCGNFLMENCLNKKANIHCDKCGRRILWEKVE